MSRMTQDDLLAVLRDRFGDDPMAWAFICPHCSDVATGLDFREALAEHPHKHKDGTPVMASHLLGQECIGRTLGALSKAAPYTGRGCDWTAYGLFRGPLIIDLGDGKSVGAFDPAPSGSADAGGTT